MKRLVAGLGLVAIMASGCGGSARRPVTVLGAASLTGAFRNLTVAATQVGIAPAYAFAGTPALVEQVRRGSPGDVIAAADPSALDGLVHEGRLERPVIFARNVLVVVVPRAHPGRVRAVADLGRSGVRVVLAAAPVPAGKYARDALRELGLLPAVAANVVSNEDDVKAVATKVGLGEADAGIVYRTDALADARLQVVGAPLPATASYAAAVIRDSRHDAAARSFIALLLSDAGRRVLRAAGFDEP